MAVRVDDKHSLLDDQRTISGPVDEMARVNAAIAQVVKIWSDRLSFACIIATLSMAIDSVLLHTAVNLQDSSFMLGATSFALVFHFFGAVIPFMASFALVRFKLADFHGQITGPSSNAFRVERVRPFRRSKRALPDSDSRVGVEPETDMRALERLFRRSHLVSVLLVLSGFTALVVGVLAFAWYPLSAITSDILVGIVLTVVVGLLTILSTVVLW